MTSTLRRACAGITASALLAATPAQPQVRLPALGEAAGEEFSIGTEKRLGDQIMREIRRDPDYLDDPVLLDYLLAVWQPLMAAARQRGDIEPGMEHQLAWEPFLIRDRLVNAFALPGGYFGVYLGLISLTATSDELASVLAHELSHVSQRHIARSIVNSQRASMAGLAALLAGILVAARSNNSDVANAAIAGSQAATLQAQLNFSRDMEREADRNGFGILGAAGYATSGMASMFEKLDTANRLNDNGSFPYLRSHPLTVDRMAEARSRAIFGGTGAAAPPLRHALMRARARVLMDPDPQALRRLQQQWAGVPGTPLRDRLTAAYAGALAASLLRDHAAADRITAAALALAAEASPREPLAERDLVLLQAQVQMARGDSALALRTLDGLAADGGARAPLLLRAQAALEQRPRTDAAAGAALRSSTEALQTWVAVRPSDAGAWAMLSNTSDAIGLRLRSLRASAEARAASGDLTGAIDRLRAGQQAARSAAGQDFIEASVIDARLRELQSQRRALALEARGGKPGPDDGNEPRQQ